MLMRESFSCNWFESFRLLTFHNTRSLVLVDLGFCFLVKNLSGWVEIANILRFRLSQVIVVANHILEYWAPEPSTLWIIQEIINSTSLFIQNCTPVSVNKSLPTSSLLYLSANLAAESHYPSFMNSPASAVIYIKLQLHLTIIPIQHSFRQTETSLKNLTGKEIPPLQISISAFIQSKLSFHTEYLNHNLRVRIYSICT